MKGSGCRFPEPGVSVVKKVLKKALMAVVWFPAKVLNGLLNFLCAAFLEGYAHPKEA